MRFFTPKEFVMVSALQYPTLYNGPSEAHIEFAVFDHLFNVNGNGIRDSEELQEYLEYREFDAERAAMFMRGETIWYGWYTVSILLDDKYSIGERCPDRGMVYCLESEKHLHPDILKWTPASISLELAPYPNFKEDYSLVYKTNFLEIAGEAWLSAALWYYRRCETFFNSSAVGEYCRAYPANSERETLSRFREWSSRFAELSKTKTNEEISAMYGHTYNGNTEEFLIGYWEVERQRILSFIEKTCALIQSHKISGHYDE